jgi:hypothetical protein
MNKFLSCTVSVNDITFILQQEAPQLYMLLHGARNSFASTVKNRWTLLKYVTTNNE